MPRRVIAIAAAALALGARADVASSACAAGEACRAAAEPPVLLQVQPAHLSSVAEHSRQMARKCHFSNAPETPYYWDPSCLDAAADDMAALGCFADSVSVECRFCGEAPYASVPCPKDAIVPAKETCRFDNPPVTPFFWDPTCKAGDKGCKADNEHVGCRWCGQGNYSDTPCPQCTFPNEPRVPYYFDTTCAMGVLGCMADGIHVGCRFCGKRPFHEVECPEDVKPPAGECWFPHGQEMPHYWEPLCAMGELGCWADGVHAECRFCGHGNYSSVPCPQAKN